MDETEALRQEVAELEERVKTLEEILDDLKPLFARIRHGLEIEDDIRQAVIDASPLRRRPL